MKSWTIVFPVLFFLAVSCSEEKKQNLSTTANILLAEELNVDYLVDVDTTGADSWQKEFVSSEFMAGFRSMVLSGKIPVFSPFYDDTAGNRIAVNMIEAELGKANDQSPYAWGKYNMYSLGFNEKWSFDTATKVFEKKMLFWRPVFQLPADSIKQSLFNVNAGETEDLLAGNVIYELNFLSEYADFKHLDFTRLYTVLVQMALTGKITVYAPGDCNTKLTADQIKERLGEAAVLEEVINKDGLPETKSVMSPYEITELQGIIFVEDWMYTTRNGSFSKKVNGFGPVRYFRDSNGDVSKSIPFIFFTGDKKVNVL